MKDAHKTLQGQFDSMMTPREEHGRFSTLPTDVRQPNIELVGTIKESLAPLVFIDQPISAKH